MRTKIDLSWNLGDMELQPSELYYTHIAINSDYKWGRGWTKEEAKRFKEEVYPKLEAEGFYIEYPIDRDDSSCPVLKHRSVYDKTDVYMHPMEFTGYLSKADCDKVTKVLQDCECVYGLRLAQQQECYKISDNMYECMILENIHAIMDGYASFCDEYEYKRTSSTAMQEFAFEFAKEYRLPRVGDGTGISSDDIDVRTVHNMLTVAKELGYMDKEKSKNQMKNREGAER